MIVPEHAEDDAAVVAVERRLPASVEFLLVRDHVFERLAPSTTPQPMLAIVARPCLLARRTVGRAGSRGRR